MFSLAEQCELFCAVPGMDRSRMDAVFSQLAEPTPAYAEQQMQQLTNMQHVYEQRDEAVAALIKEVTEIQEVMRDISVLVVEQGTMVDRIDQNIEAAVEAVDRGVEHIRRAHESSKNGAMATCIFVLLVLIAIMFVLMVIIKII
jgi:syntaxin 16